MKVRRTFDERDVNFSEERRMRQHAWGLPEEIRSGCVDRTIARLELTLIRRLHSAFDGQRAPFTGRPGVAVARAGVVRMAGAGHSECLAHDDRAPRVRCLVYRGERPDTLADGPLLFGAGTHEEARVVDEVHEGQAERVA